ncbi:membrane protein required for beta-lactamase induction [Xanthomonas campestris]|nr:membrane protein required for beta-lactamase induction [Xanthomonas sp. CFBP 8151]
MKTESNSMTGKAVGAVGGFREDDAVRAVPKKVMTPHNRFFWWFSLSLLLLGPFGFIAGPLMARRGLRKAERLYPKEAGAARQRDRGFSWGQWWVMTPLTVTMGLGAMAILKSLPILFLVLCAQLSDSTPINANASHLLLECDLPSFWRGVVGSS